MKKETISKNLKDIQTANTIIVHTSNNRTYLYDGKYQYKLHEAGYWDYYNYPTNYDYIGLAFNIEKIKKIELIFSNQNYNKTIKD